MVYIYIFSEIITRYSTNKSVVKVLTSCLSSVWSPGVRGDPSDEEDLFCCWRDPTSDHLCSYRDFSADVLAGRCAGMSLIYIRPDEGLLCIHDTVPESGLGCCD
ncbi:hypothetical protein ATANTOWER_028746 [Ataeniobius toweri]|uniref:Uncharacterized protein n=1 Tax=Ataeniobius toweri TaxID=208326 RepID=A0ABU7C5S5_9TELE|nr:hypothetical protein [Ataeniobius toweri]